MHFLRGGDSVPPHWMGKVASEWPLLLVSRRQIPHAPLPPSKYDVWFTNTAPQGGGSPGDPPGDSEWIVCFDVCLHSTAGNSLWPPATQWLAIEYNGFLLEIRCIAFTTMPGSCLFKQGKFFLAAISRKFLFRPDQSTRVVPFANTAHHTRFLKFGK